VVDAAVKDAGVSLSDISAIAYTRGPGLMGALLVGSSFAKGMAIALNVPLIDVNHLHAHILSVFIARNENEKRFPGFPFLCLLVSGGHTQLVIMKDHLNMEIIGQTIDDAAGEAFDKCAKIMGLPYPGGPVIDQLAANGNPNAFTFRKAVLKNLDFSFSGLKTSFLYFLRDKLLKNKNFINENLTDLCASIQESIVESLTHKLKMAAKVTGIHEIAIVGGVSANSGLRAAVSALGSQMNWNLFIPDIRYATDNAAMIAVTGFYKFQKGQFSSQSVTPVARFNNLS
jgi:N6-L-threonylcarbamoyladenine synthase